MNSALKRLGTALLGVLALLGSQAQAGNGINVIGFGAASLAMGGADLAMSGDVAAALNNPAGLARIPGQREFSFSPGLDYIVHLRHQDAFGNDRQGAYRFIPLGGGGYAQKLGNGDLTVGVAFFGVGGAGNEFRDLQTAFGTQDAMRSEFGMIKASPAIAWKAAPGLALGASLNLVYSTFRQDMFPHTSTAAFPGLRIEEMRGIGAGLRLGALYEVNDRLTVGAAYGPRISVPLKHGQLVANMGAAGLGNVTYSKVRLDGFAQPAQLGIGVAFRPVHRLLVAFDVDRIRWSTALRASTLTASNPDNPAAPPSVTIPSTLAWRDQTVFALGVAFDLDQRTVLRAGYNYGRNPIPPATFNPLLNGSNERTLTLGVGVRLSEAWRFDSAVEWLPRKKLSYDNPQLPFGPGARASVEQLALHAMITRRW